MSSMVTFLQSTTPLSAHRMVVKLVHPIIVMFSTPFIKNVTTEGNTTTSLAMLMVSLLVALLRASMSE